MPESWEHHPPKIRGRRECRVHAAPTALRANEKDARRPTQVRRNHSGTPCAMVLRLLRALPGVPGLLATIACAACRTEGRHRQPANLTPASGSPTHTAYTPPPLAPTSAR